MLSIPSIHSKLGQIFVLILKYRKPKPTLFASGGAGKAQKTLEVETGPQTPHKLLNLVLGSNNKLKEKDQTGLRISALAGCSRWT
jgi:hypothetical protein